MAYLPDWEGRVRRRPLVRNGFWDDHHHELALYARGRLKDVMRPVGTHKSKRLRNEEGIPA